MLALKPRMLKLRPLLKAEITLAPALEVGDTPEGRRRIIEITGGRFSGERLSGKVLPGGGDWQVIRTDGVAYLDTRYTLQTDDGALIYVLKRVAAGEPVDPSEYYMRTTPWYETGDARYAWLNRMVCVATGARRAAAVELDVFEVL
jgi:hypothetical protein